MATLNYNWQNVASWAYSNGTATVTFYVDAKLNSQNQAGNYSIVDTRLNSTVVNNISGSGYNFQLTGSGGTSGSAVWYFGNETILTGQFRVDHNANGTAAAAIHAWVANTYWRFGQSIDTTVSLPTIPRYFSKTPNISEVSKNTTSVNIKWSTSEGCNRVRYKIDNGNWIDVFSGNATSGNFTVSNLLSNSTHSIVAECRKADSNLTSNSNTLSVTTSNKTGHLKIDGVEKDATPYIRVNGQWKVAIPYIRNNNNWERSK